MLPESLLGETIDDTYRVEGVEAPGKDGLTRCLARHRSTGRLVALHCALRLPNGVSPSAALAALRVESFLTFRIASRGGAVQRRIATGMAHLSASPIVYSAREAIEGEALADLTKRQIRWSLREALELLDGVARALSAMHAFGVVHGALSSSCVVLPRAQREAILTDVGFAAREATFGSLAFPRVHVPSSWTAPELLDGALGRVSPATDVYGLASLVLELLFGRHKASGRGRGSVRPGALAAIFARALAPFPSERTPDVETLWRSLRESLATAANAA